MISYQGRLTNAAGTPITSQVTLTFSFYDSISSGDQLPVGSPYTYSIAVTPNDLGFCSVVIGDSGGTGGIIPREVFATENVFLTISVKQGDTPAEPLSPRMRVVSSAYAIYVPNPSALDAADGSPANVISVNAAGQTTITGKATFTADDGTKISVWDNPTGQSGNIFLVSSNDGKPVARLNRSTVGSGNFYLYDGIHPVADGGSLHLEGRFSSNIENRGYALIPQLDIISGTYNVWNKVNKSQETPSASIGNVTETINELKREIDQQKHKIKALETLLESK